MTTTDDGTVNITSDFHHLPFSKQPEALTALVTADLGHFRKQMARRTDAAVGPEGTYKGKTWADMKGSTKDEKMLKFYLYRRDLLEPEDEEINLS